MKMTHILTLLDGSLWVWARVHLAAGGNSNLLSERMSRSGKSLSPKREQEECSIVGLTRSLGKSFDVLVET